MTLKLRTWITGAANGTLAGLQTNNKSSIVAAINELKSQISGGGSGGEPLFDVIPVEEHLITVTGVPNTDADSWFGDAAEAYAITFTPEEDTSFLVHWPYQASNTAASGPAYAEIYVFEGSYTDPNDIPYDAQSIADANAGLASPFSGEGGITYTAVFVCWDLDVDENTAEPWIVSEPWSIFLAGGDISLRTLIPGHKYELNTSDGEVALINSDDSGYAANDSAVAVGAGASAESTLAVAIGNTAKALDVYSTALGASSIADGTFASAIGAQAKALGNASVAIGAQAKATHTSSIVRGVATSEHDYSDIFATPNLTVETYGIRVDYLDQDSVGTAVMNPNGDYPDAHENQDHRISINLEEGYTTKQASWTFFKFYIAGFRHSDFGDVGSGVVYFELTVKTGGHPAMGNAGDAGYLISQDLVRAGTDEVGMADWTCEATIVDGRLRVTCDSGAVPASWNGFVERKEFR